MLQRDVIIEIFYERHLDYLVDVIASSCSPRKISRMFNSVGVGRNNEVCRIKPEILLNVCELLCFCVVHHPYRIKYCSMQTSAVLCSTIWFPFLYIYSIFFIWSCRCNFLMNNAIEKILILTRRRERFLVVAAVRFMRTIISRNVRPYWFLLLFSEAFILQIIWSGCSLNTRWWKPFIVLYSVTPV